MRSIALFIVAVATMFTTSVFANGSTDTACSDSAGTSDNFASQYEVKVGVVGNAKKLILKPGTWEADYPTRILNAMSCPVNFAGHYTLVNWGQGTETKVGVIIDRNTGKVYPLPLARWGYAFRKDNDTLYVDRVVPDSADVGPNFEIGVYRWNEDKKHFDSFPNPVTSNTEKVKVAVYGPEGEADVLLVEQNKNLPLEDQLLLLNDQVNKYCEQYEIMGCTSGIVSPTDWTVYVIFCEDTMASYATTLDKAEIEKDLNAQDYDDVSQCKVMAEL